MDTTQINQDFLLALALDDWRDEKKQEKESNISELERE